MLGLGLDNRGLTTKNAYRPIYSLCGSCRSASASAAVARDVNIDTVMKSAGWARESTFRRFYQRQVLKLNEGYNLVRSSRAV
jgi:hypothetical protein